MRYLLCLLLTLPAWAITDEERAEYLDWYDRWRCAGLDGINFNEDDRDSFLTCHAWRLILTTPDPDPVIEALETGWAHQAELDPLNYAEYVAAQPFVQHVLYNLNTGLSQHCMETPFGAQIIQQPGLGSLDPDKATLTLNSAIPEGFISAVDYCAAWADARLLGLENPPVL